MSWDLPSIGIVLLSGSMVLAGIMIAARLTDLTLPGGPLLILMLLALMVMGASILVVADYRRERCDR